MHLAFILDGNRRYAQKQGVIKMLGHTSGADNIEPILDLCLKNNIEYVSMWALAKKNIEQRGAEELDHIYGLIRSRFKKLLPKLLKNGIKFETLGDLTLIPDDAARILRDTVEATKDGKNLTFILVISYGGQDEIIRGVKHYIRSNNEALMNGKVEELLENLNEISFHTYLDSGRFPAPDLIVRTGGDIRHSGYWLYSSEYCEYYFTDKLWPEFDEVEFHKALDFFHKTKRNFGK